MPSWGEDRAAVFEAIRGLREWCETLTDQLAAVQKQPWHPVYGALKQWGDAECARIEKESLQQQREEEPLELPSLHGLRQAQ